MNKSITSVIYVDDSQTRYYDTLNVSFHKQYITTRKKKQTILKRITRDLKAWHEKMLAEHADRELYVRVSPETFRINGDVIAAYARYQFVDKSIIHTKDAVESL